MARTHGKDLNFSINAVSLEGELERVRMAARVPEADITAFADVYQNALAGKRDVQLEISGSYDPAASGGDDTIFGLIGTGPKSTVLDPTGAGPDTNAPTYNCTASGLTGSLVRRYSLNFPVGGKAAWEATIQNSGQTTRATS